MFHRPVVDLKLDHDSAADPLNPMVNYTHWRPSPEQRDPNIPLAFKIYGIGGLVLFVAFLVFVVVYVAYKEIKNHMHNSRKGEDEEFLHSEKPLVVDASPGRDSPVSLKTLLELDKSDYDIPTKPLRVMPSGHPCLGPQEASLLEPADTIHNEEKEHPYTHSLPKGILKTSPTYIARPRGLFTPGEPVSPRTVLQESPQTYEKGPFPGRS